MVRFLTGWLASLIPLVAWGQVTLETTTGPTIGGTPLSLSAPAEIFRGTPAGITVGGVSCTSIGLANGTITCTLPAGQGINLPVVVSWGGLFPAIITATGAFRYLPPTVNAPGSLHGPTAGGTQIVLTGANLGQSGTVFINGIACTNGSWMDSLVQVSTPPSVGTNLPLVLVVGGQTSNPLYFSYDPPQIDSLTPDTGPTAGGTVVTLTGRDFGPSSTNGSVTLGHSSCSINSWRDGQISFRTPTGQGAYLPVVVTVAGQSSPAVRFNYTPPSNVTASPLHGPTAGGTAITLAGQNLGQSGAVLVGSLNCSTVSWTDTQVQVTTPPGTGTNRTLILVAGDQPALALFFSYDAPQVRSATPPTGPTAGGTQVTLQGTNFGAFSTDGTVTLGGNPCPIDSWADGQIVLRTPVGQGINQRILVTVAGQSSSSAVFSYSAPSNVTASPLHGPTLGGGVITLTGQNFGQSGAVWLNGANCSTVAWTDSQVQVTTPRGVGTNLPLVLIVGSQTSAPLYYSYDPPQITSAAPASGPTAGGTLVTLQGTNFGAFSTNGLVTLGGIVCSNVSWQDGQIIFRTPAGQGANLPVVATVAGQSSAPGRFSYSPPEVLSASPLHGPTAGGASITLIGHDFGSGGVVLLNGVACTNALWTDGQVQVTTPPGVGTQLPLVLVAGAQTSNPLTYSYDAPQLNSVSPNTGPTAGGTLVTLQGKNFGAFSTNGMVTLGGIVCSNVLWQDGQIIFRTPAGQGANLPVVATVAGQSSAPGLFSYSPPVVLSANPLHGPTAGGVLITLIGQNFGQSGVVLLNGVACMNGLWTDSQVQVTSPPGVGTNLPLVLVLAGQMSNPLSYSYDAPLASTLNPHSGPTVGGTSVTLRGTNFGASSTNGTVTLGGQTCSITSWQEGQIVFITPAGQGTNLPLVVTVAGLSSNPAYFNYEPPSIGSIGPVDVARSGGTPVLIMGTNFGLTGQVFIGGVECPVVDWTHGIVNVLAPPGTGLQLTLTLVTGGQSTSKSNVFNYDWPVLYSPKPAIGPTVGGTLLAMAADWLGTNGVLTFGGTNVVPLSYADQHITFRTPAGQGTNIPITVITGGATSNPVYFNYAAPAVNSVTPQQGPTLGGTLITLVGANFGQSGVVLVGGAAATNSVWTDGFVQVFSPPGVGTSVPLVLIVGGQSSRALSYNYTLPVLLLSVTNGGVLLSWPLTAADYLPETTSALPAGAAQWSPLSLPRQTNGASIETITPVTSTNQFFRLRRYF